MAPLNSVFFFPPERASTYQYAIIMGEYNKISADQIRSIFFLPRGHPRDRFPAVNPGPGPAPPP